MPLLHDLATGAYVLGIRIAALWSPKARAWVTGRQGLWERLERVRNGLQDCIWVHSASVGEFEQVLPVLERLTEAWPGRPVLLTFFSPSGHHARHDHPLATHVEYLPADTAANARRFVELVRPGLVLWAKYDFWHHHLSRLHQTRVPLFLISASFRKDQPFFRWFGASWRRMLGFFTHLFVQNERSQELLEGIGIRNVTVSGDTRFDRVTAIVAEARALPIARAFRKASELPVVVAGSTWSADEALLAKAAQGRAVRLVAVPHEPVPEALERIEQAFPAPVVRWSFAEERMDTPPPAHMPPDQDPLHARTLLVDRMGLLANLYREGDLAYVGGGFTDGIHSILEAAAWGRPVIFGPRHRKFPEAAGLIAAGGGFEVRDAPTLAACLDRLLSDPLALQTASQAAARFIQDHTGATNTVVEELLRHLPVHGLQEGH